MLSTGGGGLEGRGGGGLFGRGGGGLAGGEGPQIKTTNYVHTGHAHAHDTDMADYIL